MHYKTVSDSNFQDLGFVPTMIIAFYRSSQKAAFLKEYEWLHTYYPDAEIIGCSSSGNIADDVPYVETTEQFPIVYFCCDMKKDAFAVHLFSEEDEIEESQLYEQVVLLSSFSSPVLETHLADFSKSEEIKKVYGAVAGAEFFREEHPSIFYNGSFYTQHMLLWSIDAQRYTLDGMSMHLFRPAGIPLEITRAEHKTLYEINNLPALDVIEEITGKIDELLIGRFGYPLFVQKHTDMEWSNAPLASIVAVNREEGSLQLYRDVYPKEYVKVGIMLSRQDQLRRLGRLYALAPRKSAALMFHCIGIAENLKMMEYLYLEEIKYHIDVSFAGFHSFGEIGPSASRKPSEDILLHNQTITVALIAEKDKV